MKSCRLGDIKAIDEISILFITPPIELVLYHGDDYLEVWDYAIDCSWVDTALGQIKTTPNTIMYYH